MTPEEIVAKKREIDRIKAQRRKDKIKEWQRNNRDRINELANRRKREIRARLRVVLPRDRKPWTNSGYRKERAARDINFRLKISMCINMHKRFARIRTAKATTTWRLIGCTVQQLREHIERQWQPGMSWDNYGFQGVAH